MAQSHIDSTDYGKGLARALKIKGVRQVPDKLNVDQIQITADSMQGGFSIYEKKHFDVSEAITPTGSMALTLFDPRITTFPLASAQNNQLEEIRLISMRIRIAGVTAIAGNTIDVQLRYIDLPTGLVLPCVSMAQAQIAGKGQYTWYLPYMVEIPGGSYQFYQGWNWNGWIPAAESFGVQITKQTAFAGTETLTVVSSFITVPKGCQLPM